MVRTVETGEQIGEVDCPACGAKVPVKVNRNGCVYSICQNIVKHSAETGKPERCFFRLTYGREKSREIISEYLASIEVLRAKDEDDVEPDYREEGEQADAACEEESYSEAYRDGSAERGAAGGAGDEADAKPGLGAAVLHFLTGDE